MRAKWVVIEGTDASGKETQKQNLYEKLKEKYAKVLKISFPNYDNPACTPVKMYLAGDFGHDVKKLNALSRSTMYAIDRDIHHIRWIGKKNIRTITLF